MIPVERAARSLSRLAGNSEDAPPGDVETWQSYVPQVLAVIEALHEPSEHMKEAGAEIFHAYMPEHSEFAHQDDAAGVWRMMIDAVREDVG